MLGNFRKQEDHSEVIVAEKIQVLYALILPVHYMYQTSSCQLTV